MANMILGILILNKSYDVWKYISVIMITVGIFICTIATGSDVKKSQSDKDSLFYWMIGVCMLSLALFVSGEIFA
jgi:UDP-xylose/UDP-N-acetylglucosamine transporter B4